MHPRGNLLLLSVIQCDEVPRASPRATAPQLTPQRLPPGRTHPGPSAAVCVPTPVGISAYSTWHDLSDMSGEDEHRPMQAAPAARRITAWASQPVRVHRDHSRHTRGLRAAPCGQVQPPGPDGWPRGAGTPDDSLNRQLTRRPGWRLIQPAATRKSTRAGQPTSRQGLEGTGRRQCTGLTSKPAM